MTEQEARAIATVLLTIECEVERLDPASRWRDSFERVQNLLDVAVCDHPEVVDQVRNEEAARFLSEGEEEIRKLTEGEA
jgi:hypothetical protein